MDDKTARKLSSALGRHVTADEIEWTSEGGDTVQLKDGTVVGLDRGNSAYIAGTGQWMKYGRVLSEEEIATR
jgi:hypothetical protein